MFACKTAFDFLGHFSVSSQYRRERFKNKLFLFETVCNLICVFVCFYLSYEDVIFVRFQIQRLLNCEKIKRCRNNFVSYCAVKVLLSAWADQNPREWGGGGGSAPQNFWWGCAARFSKPWLYLRPKYAMLRCPLSQ